MESTYENSPSIQRKRRLHVVVFSVFAVVFSAILMFGLGNIHTEANRQRGNFINQDFRNATPNTGNIIYSLRGDGTPANTAYTRTWTGSCLATNVVTVPAGFTGGNAAPNTIYLINSGTYTLTQNINLANCSALIGRGEVIIKGTTQRIGATSKQYVIMDNLNLSGVGVTMDHTNNTTLHNLRIHNTTNAIVSSVSHSLMIAESQTYNTTAGIVIVNSMGTVINNVMSYNNLYGISINNEQWATINNSQIFNNQYGIVAFYAPGLTIHASAIYNNMTGAVIVSTGIINGTNIYNNTRGSTLLDTLSAFGAVNFFDNTAYDFTGAGSFSTTGSVPSSLGRSAGAITVGTETTDYDRVTNPLSPNNDAFFTGSIFTWTTQRGILAYNFSTELRYLFGLHMLKQEQPVYYLSGVLTTYGSDGADYTPSKYIAETDPVFSTPQLSFVNQYFGSGSMYTQNRSGNGCTIGAFQIVTLNSGNYTPYTLQSHTIYVLNSGEYTFTNPGNGFTFGGNCIALIGSGDVRIDKHNANVTNLISATDKRNLIIENVKLDGKYLANGSVNGMSNAGVSFAGATWNTTINQVQSYNQRQYGIFLGAGSHHNTIINTQVYDNGEAGMYLYLVSHHNVINNSMAWNNSGYGIRFANGSNRNAMNNFQSFNNLVGIYGDLTTKENIINRAMIYNNSQYGILLKNSSGNIFNDIQVYNNTTGIKVALNSNSNSYNGALKLFNNGADLEGTDANDGYLNDTNTSPFTAGTLTLGSNLMNCSYVTNPTLSGTTTSLLNTLSGCMLTGLDYSVFSGLVTSINYTFGADIYKQTLPYRYTTNNTIQAIPMQYDSGKYVAEIFAIWDNVLEGVSFSFGTGIIEPNTLYTTNVYTAGVINTTVAVSLLMNPSTSTGYLIINGSGVGQTGTVINGDTIQIAMMSSGTLAAIETGTLLANNSPIATIILQTKGPDITPSTGSFAFANIIGSSLHTYTGSMVTVSNIDIGVLATINTGRIAIYSGGSLVSSGSTGMVYSGNQLLAEILSASGYTSGVTALITIGNGTGSFTVRTIPDTSSPILSFSDPIASGVVASDTIAVIASGNTSPVVYKFITNPGDCTSSGTTLYSGAITISGEQYNGKYFCAYAELSGIAMPLISPYTVHIDATAPTIPILLYPENSDEVFYVIFEQTGSYDSGAGISGYEYVIAADYNFIDIIATGFVVTTGTSFSPNNFTETTGDFYRKIRTIDNVGLSSTRSSQGYFFAIDDENFFFDERTYAALHTEYTSNEILIAGLRTYGMAYASVDTGTIYKNGINKGQATYVQNGDKIAIKLTSSHNRDESEISTLTVANRTTDYVVTTSPDANSCTLSSQDRGTIQIIYNNLVAQYVTGDQNRYDEFLYTMRSMLQDQIDLTNDCNLQYLYDLLDNNLQDTNGTEIDTTGYIAPNCKVYLVSYDTGKVAYTSPNFKVATYFSNRNALGRYIDNKNPGDCHVSTTVGGNRYFNNTDPTKHIAPNGKVYTIQHETGGYTSAEFSVKKYFGTLVLLRKYLDGKNPPFPIWSHVVDPTFTPVTYTAPNGKVYKIYKTNRGYMSYLLMNIKYYTTLDAIKAFINKNNPK